jgi:alcohol dehydrogenase class IV
MALHHRICHVLGGTYGLVHGDVNVVILPHAVAFNQEGAPEAIARVARALGVENAASGLFDLAAEIGAPTSLAELGMARGDLEEAARQAADPPPWNPRAVEVGDVAKLLLDAYRGVRPGAHLDGRLREEVGTGTE